MGYVTTPRIPAVTPVASNTKRIGAAPTANNTSRTRVPDPLLTEDNHLILCEVGSDYLECE